jgi:hypothetical protein
MGYALWIGNLFVWPLFPGQQGQALSEATPNPNGLSLLQQLQETNHKTPKGCQSSSRCNKLLRHNPEGVPVLYQMQQIIAT